MNLWTSQLERSGDTGHFKGRDRIIVKGSSPPTACLTSVTLKAIYSINSIWLGVWPWLGAICSAHTLRSLCICRWCVSGVLCLDDGMWVCVGKCCSELPSLSISLLIVAALDKCLCCKKHRNHSSYMYSYNKKILETFFFFFLQQYSIHHTLLMPTEY